MNKDSKRLIEIWDKAEALFTEEERNVLGIKRKIAVRCETQDEWDFLNSKLPQEIRMESHIWEGVKYQSAKCLNEKKFSTFRYLKSFGYIIISYKEWFENIYSKS